MRKKIKKKISFVFPYYSMRFVYLPNGYFSDIFGVMKKQCLFIIQFLLFSFIFADYNKLGIPGSSEIRKDYVESWFTAPLDIVRMNKPEVRENNIDEKFQIRLEESEKSFSIYVSPHSKLEIEVFSDKEKTKEIHDVYLGDAVGSWVLNRDKTTGKPIFIRFYFAGNSDVFIQFSPFNKKSKVDFILFNCYAVRGIPLGISFDRFYTASFAEIQKWTKNIVPWNFTDILTDNYSATLQMIDIIRKNLEKIVFLPDAMYDDDNQPIYVSSGENRIVADEYKEKITLNGAGFLKWIADGIVEPIAGSKLKREPLITETVKHKDVGFQGILNISYSTSFSLDWIRNLSSAIASVRTNRVYLFNKAGADVSIQPFSSINSEGNVKNASAFMNNVGYNMAMLKPLLYVLAATEPDTFYFAAIRSTDKKSPEVKVFNDCAICFPFFDKSSRFNCVIFKDGKELSLDDFLLTYQNDEIFLTRVKSTKQFVLE